ncbi:MAG: hypothetical protein SPJ62_11635 [Inconstantimicrobium porci]|uniref:hypothetical protein n=1 Tax=Inconstantimicrobium porci TaxID=2652291 RepID=UPI002A90A283|nr:hypothetical protein [Inconstantimicrobium porci]MDY5912629.1 hypothetical protein [Inconstantimicrobium porci]
MHKIYTAAQFCSSIGFSSLNDFFEIRAMIMQIAAGIKNKIYLCDDRTSNSTPYIA